MCYPPKEEDHTLLNLSIVLWKEKPSATFRVVDLVPFFECFKPLLLNEHTTILLKKGSLKVSNTYVFALLQKCNTLSLPFVVTFPRLDIWTSEGPEAFLLSVIWNNFSYYDLYVKWEGCDVLAWLWKTINKNTICKPQTTSFFICMFSLCSNFKNVTKWITTLY